MHRARRAATRRARRRPSRCVKYSSSIADRHRSPTHRNQHGDDDTYGNVNAHRDGNENANRDLFANQHCDGDTHCDVDANKCSADENIYRHASTCDSRSHKTARAREIIQHNVENRHGL